MLFLPQGLPRGKLIKTCKLRVMGFVLLIVKKTPLLMKIRRQSGGNVPRGVNVCVTFTGFLPHSLTLLEVTATGHQMKHMVTLNKMMQFFGFGHR